MKGYAIKNLKVTPGGDGSATSRKYVDRELDTKANKNDLNSYLKRDGSKQMSGNLQMNGKRITGLTNVPAYNGEATNKRYVDTKLNDKANKNFGVLRKLSNISRLLMNQLLSLEFYW